MKMHGLMTMAAPLLATLAIVPLAQADDLIAWLEGSGLSEGTHSYDCNLTGTNGKRGHVQTRAYGEDIYGLAPETVYALESGTSQSTDMGYPGKRHRAFLESHLIDTGNGTDTVDEHCRGSWTSGWQSSGSTNVSSCSAWVRSSTGQYSGSCGWRVFEAKSMGADN